MSSVSVTLYGSYYTYVAVNADCAYVQQGDDVLRTKDGVAFTLTGQRPNPFCRLLGSRVQTALFARDNRDPALYVSRDGGASWDQYSVPLADSNYFFYASATRILIYSPGSNKVFASSNDGQSWTASTSTDVAEIVAVPSGFYMVSANRLAVQYSTDGVSWQAVPSDAPIAALYPAVSSGEVFVAAQAGYRSSLAVVKGGRLTSIAAPTSTRDRSGLAAVKVGDSLLVVDPTSSNYIGYATLDAAPEVLTSSDFIIPQAGGPVGKLTFGSEGFLSFSSSGGVVSTLFWTALAKAYETP